MKTKIFTLLLAVSLFSCKSVDKMIEKGNYDDAINYSLGKLVGKKNKSQKYVIALEKAYEKASKDDIRQINYLAKKGNDRDLDAIYTKYIILEKRQQKITPLLPLISEEGYKAQFDIVNYEDKIIKAANMASEYHYQSAINLLDQAKTQRIKAREAYAHLEQIERYNANYKNSQQLIQKALELGTVYVSIEHENRINSRDSWYIEEAMINWPFYKLDDRWTQFVYYNDENLPIDYFIVMNINDIDVGFERESVNKFTVKKEIEVLKSKNELEKIALDSTKTEKDKYKKIKVKAEITEIKREKHAYLDGGIRIINNNRSIIERSIPIAIVEHFEGYSSRYDGDKRAIEGNSDINLDNFCEEFPTDLFMLNSMSDVLKETVFTEIRRRNFELPY